MNILLIILKIFVGIVLLFLVVTAIFWIFAKARNDRDWEFGQEKAQLLEKNGDIFTINDLRDFNWLSKDKNKIEHYKDLSFKSSDVEYLEVGVSHFSAKESIAHVFLIFNLKDKNSFSLSIESRREKGEDFSILGGLLFKYELIYILATKKDLLDIRKNRNERVYLYKIKSDEEGIEKLLNLLSKRIDSLNKNPEFYHLFFKNCTNLIVKEVEKVSSDKFSFFVKNFAPGYSGKTLFDMNLIDTDKKTFKEAQKEFLVDFSK